MRSLAVSGFSFALVAYTVATEKKRQKGILLAYSKFSLRMFNPPYREQAVGIFSE